MELQRGSGPFCALTCPPSSSNCWALCAWWWTAKVMIKKTALMWIVRSQIKETSLHKHIKLTCMQSCFRYGSSFPPLKKKKKVIATFYLTIQTFFSELRDKLVLRIVSLNHAILTLFLRIASLYIRIMTFLIRNCEFVSRSYEKKSQNCEIRSWNNLFLFFIQWRKRASIL